MMCSFPVSDWARTAKHISGTPVNKYVEWLVIVRWAHNRF